MSIARTIENNAEELDARYHIGTKFSGFPNALAIAIWTVTIVQTASFSYLGDRARIF